MDERVIGVLGGGQLGRMMAQAASRLSIPLITLDSASSPASQVSSPSSSHPQFKSPALSHQVGGFDDPHAILAFSKSVDVLTVEIEHVDVQVLKEVRDDPQGGRSGKGVQVWPAPEVVETIQDKFAQKDHLASHGVPVAEYLSIEPDGHGGLEDGVRQAGKRLGWPLMLKSRRLAYDGRGNYLVKTESDVASAVKALVTPGQPMAGRLYAEKFAPFQCEIACMVVRSPSADVRTFPPVETVHQNNICHLVYAPLRRGGPEAKQKARQAAIRAINSFGSGAVGVFGVEMFLMPDGEILVNEIAPRPHNSYHHTLASTPISQFTAHLLAILSMPLPPHASFSLSVPSAAMLNVLGATDGDAGVSETRTFIRRAATEVAGCSVEWYGKFGCRKGRKLGHVNVVGQSDAEVRDRLDQLLAIMPGQQAPPARTGDRILSALNPLSADKTGFSDPRPLVSIIMGSDSDLPTMLAASTVLDHPLFRVPHELTIVSAHRTPRRMYDFAASARSRGVRVIIAGAGGAAHLPGMVAALTTLPVVGVPVKGSVLDGVDSLHSIVQMPRGVPVATVAINNSTNAALLAIRILASERSDETADDDGDLARGLSEYVDGMEGEVMAKVDKLAGQGWHEYAKAMKR